MQILAVALALTLIASIAEAQPDIDEAWKCKIQGTMGIAVRGGEPSPTRFVGVDQEYRVLGYGALKRIVGVDKVVKWRTDPQFKFKGGHYYARSTLLSPDNDLGWTPLIPGNFGYRSRSRDMFFSPETGKLETRPWIHHGWFNGNDKADYSFEFAQCTLYYD